MATESVPGRVAIAVAALVRDGRVLMAHRRPARRWYPDCWDLVGGHVEPGETAEAAAVRECAEGLGVRVFDPRPIPMTFTDRSIDMHAFVIVDWEGEPVNVAPDEHDQLRWFAPDELPALVLADPAAVPDIEAAVMQSHDV